MGSHIPQTDQGKGWECPLEVPVNGRNGHSFQSWVVRLPVKMGGMGVRSLEDVSPAAFLGAMEQCVPSFPGPEGVCPQLSDYLGGEESFGESAVGGD